MLSKHRRAQTLRIQPISDAESLKILEKTKLDEDSKRRILFLASGLPGEIQKLASEKRYFNEQMELAEIAKRWFLGSKFEKMLISKDLKDREKTLRFLEILLKIINQTFVRNPENSAINAQKTLKAYDKITKNGNIKLSLLELIVC